MSLGRAQPESAWNWCTPDRASLSCWRLMQRSLWVSVELSFSLTVLVRLFKRPPCPTQVHMHTHTCRHTSTHMHYTAHSCTLLQSYKRTPLGIPHVPHTCAATDVCMHTHVYAQVHTHSRTRSSAHTLMPACAHVRAHSCLHICTHTHTHTHTHTQFIVAGRSNQPCLLSRVLQ